MSPIVTKLQMTKFSDIVRGPCLQARLSLSSLFRCLTSSHRELGSLLFSSSPLLASRSLTRASSDR